MQCSGKERAKSWGFFLTWHCLVQQSSWTSPVKGLCLWGWAMEGVSGDLDLEPPLLRCCSLVNEEGELVTRVILPSTQIPRHCSVLVILEVMLHEPWERSIKDGGLNSKSNCRYEFSEIICMVLHWFRSYVYAEVFLSRLILLPVLTRPSAMSMNCIRHWSTFPTLHAGQKMRLRYVRQIHDKIPLEISESLLQFSLLASLHVFVNAISECGAMSG